MNEPSPPLAAPWWRVGIVWLVIGATAAVVVACIWMIRVSKAGADIVVVQPPSTSATVPAMQGRNHVASPKP